MNISLSTRLKAEADTLSAGKKKHVTAIDDYRNVKEEDEEEEFWVRYKQ